MTHNEDFEFIKNLANLTVPSLKDFDNVRYKVNETQMNKFIKIVETLKKYTQENDDASMEVSFGATHENGEITLSFSVMDLRNKWLRNFIEVFQNSDMVGIEATLDGIVNIDISVKKCLEAVLD